ncbi:MAG TPA: helix-turn-helix transcriptional regulator [Thermoanaerobaculia bacterium]|jgi:tetratricopeptide (TPR) repeat protein/DNA-binding XRE family transcriptional regulator|nr:helix-turn-helix transcriptional regulator [Thermoanaerobaculia bacterium]
MRRENLKARLLRAVSGKTQVRLAGEIDLHPSRLAQIESGDLLPRRQDLERMAHNESLTVDDIDEILSLIDSFRRTFQRAERRMGGFADLGEKLYDHISHARRRLLALPVLPDRFGTAPPEVEEEVAPPVEELHVRVCLELCDESERMASREIEGAAILAGAAAKVAARLPEPQGRRVRGHAAAYEANVLRVAGELKAADTALAEAKRLWHSGADRTGLLDVGRLLDLEASLRRGQRRFGEALHCLDEAVRLGRSPARALIKKGFTLEVMGQYERAVETLLQAEPRLDREAEPHLWYNHRLQLAVNYTNLERYSEASDLIDSARPLVVELGADLVGFRITWLEGRIAAGLGRTPEALDLLAQARREFAARGMYYDVALALLEEALLLLKEERTAEVETLAQELTEVFKSKGVHREALAALRLFQEATEQSTATAELAGRILRFLFRARYDEELRFTAL